MEAPVTKRRSARQLAGRKRSIYYESDSDDDAIELLDDDVGARGHAPLPSPSASPPSTAALRPRKRAKKNQKPVTRSQKPKKRSTSRPKRSQKGRSRPLGAFTKKSKAAPPEHTVLSDGVKPAWGNLPVDILRDIFVFASQPLYEPISGNANVRWLMRAARTGRDFAVPALEAYYMSPAFHNVVQPHYLLELLRLPQDNTYIKYRSKIKRLQINVQHLAYSAQGRSLFDLSSLVRELPQLQELEIVHPMDEPPYRPLKFQKWHYPLHLFDALGDSNIRLRKWRWCRDMMRFESPEEMYKHMAETHGNKSFERLDRLVIAGFDYNDSAEPKDLAVAGGHEAATPPNLTAAISRLPSLKDLTFISCDIVMEDFLLRLPNTLERLELTNCLEITSDLLSTYLATNGYNLRELVLNSNAALNMSFLTTLKNACPKLESLIMDTTYYSERTNYNDAYAFYDELLTARETPTWPTTLRHIEFSNLQKWGASAASMLFQSLIDAAPDLPDLRHLTIQAHIDIAWRDRADFRDNWIDKLQAVFLLKTPPPAEHLCSLRRYREWKEERPLPLKHGQEEDGTEAAQRRFDHVRITPRKAAPQYPAVSDESESDAEYAQSVRVQPRRSARVAETQSAASLSATPAPESPEAEDDDEESGAPASFVQGLCEVVDIRIDNQRPREQQYTEANFLDSEESGDEDWHSGAELSDDGYAW